MKVGLIITNRNKSLILERNPSRYKGWGLITGSVDLAEDIDNATKRELFEETGIKIGPQDKFKNLHLTSSYFSEKHNRKYKINWFYLDLHEKPKINLENLEWINYEWLSFHDALERLTWESEREILVKFLSEAISLEFKKRQ